MSEAPHDDAAVPTLRLAALFGISAGLLLFEIALAKIFSIILWYHFGFLVISIALLGFALSGVWMALRPAFLERGPRILAALSGGAAIATALALWLVVHTKVDAMHVLRNRNEGALLFQIGVLLVPFLFLGAAISATISQHRAKAGKVYSANLLGSGAGCALSLFLFDVLHVSGTDVVLLSALLMALSGLGFAFSDGGRGLAWPVFATLAVGAFLVWPGRHDALRLYAPESKPLYYVERWDRENDAKVVRFTDGTELLFARYRLEGDASDPTVVFVTPYEEEVRRPLSEVVQNADGTVDLEERSLIEFTEWSSLSRVDGFIWPAGEEPWGLWGLSSAWRGRYPNQRGITIDSWAMTNVMQWGGGERGEEGEPPEILEYLPSTLVHRIRPGADILCIGAGGGMDLLAAKRFGASRITGVEINASVAKVAREVFIDFQGGLYDPARHPEVRLEVAEGRHYMERDDHRYDVVQLSGVDTASTTQAGAFSLSENFLYTVEAFETYLEHAKDEGGLVTLTRWVLPSREGLPRNTLRLFVLAWRALENAGVADPGKNIYLVESNGFSVILFGKQALTDEELATLDETCRGLTYRHLYHPQRPSPNPMGSPYLNVFTNELAENQFDAFAQAEDKDAWLASYTYDVEAPVDNRPFFFETSRFRQLLDEDSFKTPLGGISSHGILVMLLGLLFLVAHAFVVLPLRRLAREDSGPLAPVILYFGSLGLGFILVEVILSQKFVLYLGNPLYSLAVVLFSVLIFSGIGSALSSRVGKPRLALGMVAGLAFVYPLFLDTLFDATLWLPTAGRIAIAVLLLAPLSVAMGMPFPLGVQRLSSGGLVSWAWGINGYTSVLGSVLAVAIAIGLGFQAVIWIGAGIYLIAFLVAPFLEGDEPY